MKKFTIDLHSEFNKQKDLIKNQLIQYIKSNWVDVEIRYEIEEYSDESELFYLYYEHGEDDNEDFITFWLATFPTDEWKYELKITGNFPNKNGCVTINNFSDLNNTINLFIRNVRNGIIRNINDDDYVDFIPGTFELNISKKLVREYMDVNKLREYEN